MHIPLIKEFEYKAGMPEVWYTLTDTAKMKQWYFPQLLQFEPVVGFQFVFKEDNLEYRKEWIVTKVSEGETLAHSWAYKGYAGSSEVTFDLFAAGTKTKLRITQTGLETFPDHAYFNRQRFEQGWEILLGQNLKQVLERSDK